MMFRRWAIAALVGVAFVGVSAALFLKLRSEDVPPIDGPTSGELPAFEGLFESTIEKSIDPEEAAPTIVDEPELAYAWQQRVIGGGGWVKGIEIHPSGEPVIARTDVGGRLSVGSIHEHPATTDRRGPGARPSGAGLPRRFDRVVPIGP